MIGDFHHVHVTGAQHTPNQNHDFVKVLDDEERGFAIDDPNIITRSTVDALAWWCLLLA
jgi:hypothetical protein